MSVKSFRKSLLSLALAVTSAVSPLSAQAAEDKIETEREKSYVQEELAPETHQHITGEWLDTFHNPAENLEMTLDARLRYVYGWNVQMDNSNNGRLDFGRYRLRWGQKLDLDENTSINSRLVWEFRTWDEPQSKPQSTDFDEILFDRLNIEIDNLFDLPLKATVGRQDIIFGTGWLVLDGTPLDGSRTIFFDAARLTWDLEETKTKVDMVYVRNDSASDAWLKPINDRNRSLAEQDEHGAILYITNNCLEDTQLEGYFIYKNDNPLDYTPNNFPAAWSKKAEIFTYGGAVQGKIDENWTYRVEGALQTGDRDGESLRAFGSNNKLTYSFNDSNCNQLFIDYEYLSGDDPSSSRDEQFDPLWGEWPQFSELYIYSYVPETAIAETTNLHRLGFGHRFNPAKDLCMKTAYNLLWADQDTNGSTGIFNGSSHTFRGQLATACLTYSCCEQLSAHIIAEYFQPGNYYDDNNRGHATFLRFNLEYTF